MKQLVAVIILFLTVTVAFPQAEPALKVGYVDIDYVYSQLPEMKAMEQKLVEMRQQMEKEYAAKQENFQRQYADLAARFDSMSDTAKAKANATIAQLQAELQQFSSEADNTLVNTRKLYMAPIYLKMGRIIAEVASENGYGLLVQRRVNQEEFVIWRDKRIDASDLVIKKLIAEQAPAPQTEKKPDK